MKITKDTLEQLIKEELQDILAEQATNRVGMPVEPVIKDMDACLIVTGKPSWNLL